MSVESSTPQAEYTFEEMMQMIKDSSRNMCRGFRLKDESLRLDVAEETQRLEAVIAANPKLGYQGWYVNPAVYGRRGNSLIAWNLEYAIDEFVGCKMYYAAILATLCRRSYSVSGYRLKHDVEYSAFCRGYVSTGSAIAAAIDMGFGIQRDGGDATVTFRLTVKELHANQSAAAKVEDARKQVKAIVRRMAKSTMKLYFGASLSLSSKQGYAHTLNSSLVLLETDLLRLDQDDQDEVAPVVALCREAARTMKQSSLENAYRAAFGFGDHWEKNTDYLSKQNFVRDAAYKFATETGAYA